MRAAGRRWPIQTRILVTLVFLTAAILLAVALTFHLFVRGYVYGRVSAQLDSMVQSARGPETRKGPAGKGRKFPGGQDRVTGVRGNVVVLGRDGELRELLNGDPETGEALSAYFMSGHVLDETVSRQPVTLDSGKYIVSVVCDPVQPEAYLVCYADVTSIQAFTGEVNLALCGIILAAIALSVILSRSVARSLAEPAQSLSAFAGEIGRGEFRPRQFSFRDAEFQSLADSMNRMAEDLRKANQKQETFFQNVSHELRTPLTSIRGNAEGIVYGIMDPRTSGQIILSEADRLGGFVEELLYLSRLGKATPEGAAVPTDLREVLSLCVSEQRAEADRRGIQFSFDFDPDPVLLAIRERDARQLFGNLLSNAIRYAASSVRLSCHRDADGVTVKVRDDGPGVSPEDMPHIFERFYRGADGKHGIGLSIVKSVSDAYHGSVTVESGGGAEFRVRFPADGFVSFA